MSDAPFERPLSPSEPAPPISPSERSESRGGPDLVARTAALLARGGLTAAVATALLAGGSTACCALMLASTSLSSAFIPIAYLGFGSLVLVPAFAHAAPLAAFTLAVAGRPRLGATMRLAARTVLALVGPMFVMASPACLVTCGLGALGELRAARELGPRLVLGGTVAAFFLTAAWVEGRFVLLSSAARVAGVARPPLGTWRGDGTVLLLGALPVSVAAAFGGRALVLSPSPVEEQAIIAGAAIALVATLLVSCALAVAIVTAPEDRP